MEEGDRASRGYNAHSGPHLRTEELMGTLTGSRVGKAEQLRLKK